MPPTKRQLLTVVVTETVAVVPLDTLVLPVIFTAFVWSTPLKESPKIRISVPTPPQVTTMLFVPLAGAVRVYATIRRWLAVIAVPAWAVIATPL
jgi:hypothetical protein